MAINARQQELLEKLRKAGRVSIEEEARFFGTSAMTVRRDLRVLEAAGFAIRTHGGAALRGDSYHELMKLSGGNETQKRIADAAVQRLRPGMTVALSAGTTTLQVAKRIAAGDLKLNVVTNSLLHAAALFQSGSQVLLTGGTLRERAMDLVGPLAEKNLSEYYVDLLIAGCDGAVSNVGFYTSDIHLASMERKSVEIAERMMIVTESRKFQKPSFAKFAELADVATVITDAGLDPADRKNLETAGVEVVLV